MKDGPGYWLNPVTGEYFRVINHAPWICDHANARSAGLPERHIAALRQYDAIRNEDEVRMATVKGGLVRTREHLGNEQHSSVQCYYDRPNVPAVLCAIKAMLRRTSNDRYADIRPAVIPPRTDDLRQSL